MKAPNERKAEIITAKIIQKGLYGCETCPINDVALWPWGSETDNAATYVTERRS